MPAAPAASLVRRARGGTWRPSEGRPAASLARSRARSGAAARRALQALAAEAVLADLAQRDAELQELLGPEGDASEALGEPSSPLGEAKVTKAAPPGASPPRMPSDPAELDGQGSAWAQLPGALSLAGADEPQDARQAGGRLSLQVPADGSPNGTDGEAREALHITDQHPVAADPRGGERGTMARRAPPEKTATPIATRDRVLGESVAAEAGARRGRGPATSITTPFEFAVARPIFGILIQSSNSTSHLTTLGLPRAIEVPRMIELVRRIETLGALRSMTAALSASRQALFRAIVLLFCTQSFVALAISNVLREHHLVAPGVLREEQKRELFEYFGTWLSTFELTLANWPPICRFMVESLHEGWMLFAVFCKPTFGFAVVGVVGAVFVQETFEVASLAESIVVKQKTRAFQAHKQKTERPFENARKLGLEREGLSFKELGAAMGDPAIKIWLQSMDIEASDAELLFTLIKNGKASDMTVAGPDSGRCALEGQRSIHGCPACLDGHEGAKKVCRFHRFDGDSPARGVFGAATVHRFLSLEAVCACFEL